MNKKAKKNFNWRLIASLIAGVLAIGFIYWQREAISDSMRALKDASWNYILFSFISFIVSVLGAALVIYSLKIKDVSFKPIITVQTASLFLARITPASSGGIAAIIRMLTTQGHNVVQASTVMGASALSTFVGNILVTAVALLFAYNKLDLEEFSVPVVLIVFAVVAVITLAVLLAIPKVRKKIISVIDEVKNTLTFYSKKKSAIIKAIGFGALVTLMYATTMLLVAYALGVELSLFSAIIAISLGSIGVAVTPLPGGAVGAEAAIAAALVQFGVAADSALAIALVYRFVTFWLPLIPGFFASQYALKKEYL